MRSWSQQGSPALRDLSPAPLPHPSAWRKKINSGGVRPFKPAGSSATLAAASGETLAAGSGETLAAGVSTTTTAGSMWLLCLLCYTLLLQIDTVCACVPVYTEARVYIP